MKKLSEVFVSNQPQTLSPNQALHGGEFKFSLQTMHLWIKMSGFRQKCSKLYMQNNSYFSQNIQPSPAVSTNALHTHSILTLNCLSAFSEEPEPHSNQDVFEEIKEWLMGKGVKEGNPQILVEKEKDNQKAQLWKSLPSKSKMKDASGLLMKRKHAHLPSLQLRE